jgi:hypothetical protein
MCDKERHTALAHKPSHPHHEQDGRHLHDYESITHINKLSTLGGGGGGALASVAVSKEDMIHTCTTQKHLQPLLIRK